jgi:transposase-like protein
VAGQWRSVYRAIDQFGQVIDVFVSARRDATAARRFFEGAIGSTKVRPAEVTTDQAPVYPTLMEELLPAAWHCTDRYANNRVEADHGRLKQRNIAVSANGGWLFGEQGMQRTASDSAAVSSRGAQPRTAGRSLG